MRSLVSRCRIGHATVAAYAALFLALGGTAYAAAMITGEDIVDETIESEDIGPQAVTTDEIAQNAVRRDHLRDYVINSAKVLDNSLTTRDINNGSLAGWDIADHSLTGSDLSLGIHLAYGHNSESDPGHTHQSTAIASCPEGEIVLGGGGATHHPTNDMAFHLRASGPWGVETGPGGETVSSAWRVVAASDNPTYSDELGVSAVAICARL